MADHARKGLFVLCCLLYGSSASAQDLVRLVASAVAGAPLQVQWTLMWDASPDPSVTGYRAYCGPSSGQYAPAVNVVGTSYPVPLSGSLFCRVSSVAGSVEGPRSAEIGIVNNVPVTPPPPPPPPPPVTTSPNGTTVPPAAEIIRTDGTRCTLSAGAATCAGVALPTSRFIDLLLWWHGAIYAELDTGWLQLVNGGLVPAGDPRTPTAPPPPPPPPPPPHPPPVLLPGPSITVRDCRVYLESGRPDSAAGTGWYVQYFDGTTAITSRSTTRRRAVTLLPGSHAISAQWSKSGQATITTQASTQSCQ